jgi:hypothetical protein
MFGFWEEEHQIESTRWNSGYFDKGKDKTNWTNLDKDVLNHILDEARLHSQYMFDSHLCLVQKVSFFIAIVIGLIGFIFTEFLSKWDYFTAHFGLGIFLGGLFVLLIMITLYLAEYLLPLKTYDPIGLPPDQLFLEEKMGFKYEEIIVNQIEVYQGSIYYNNGLDVQLAKKFKVCFWSIVIYSSVSLLMYLILLISFWGHCIHNCIFVL